MPFTTKYGFERLMRTKLEVEPVVRVKSSAESQGSTEILKNSLKWTLLDFEASMSRRNYPCRVNTCVKSPIFLLGRQLAQLALCPSRMGSDSISLHVNLVQSVFVPIKGEVKFNLNDTIERELLVSEEANASKVSWGVYDITKAEFGELPVDRVVRCTVDLVVDKVDDGKSDKRKSCTKLVENFGPLLESSRFSDVTLKVGGRLLKAHRNILSARSPVFAAMFEADSEVTVFDMARTDIRVAEALLTYIYTGRLDPRGVTDPRVLLHVAAEYGVDDLKALCGRKLCTEMTPDTVLDKLLLGDRYRASELFEAAVFFVKRNWEEVVSTEKWQNFKKSHHDLAFHVEVLIDT